MSVRRWNSVFRALAILPCCAIGLLIACSESRDSPVAIAVEGTVRDASGEPVPGARVAIEYQWDTTPLQSAGLAGVSVETPIVFDLKETTDWTIEITDYRGDPVRTFTGHDGGRVMVSWDGTNAEGRQVPDGVYFYTIEAGDDTGTRKLLYATGCDGMSGTDAYLGLADARGVYGIDWDIVPLGEMFVSLDEYGPDTTWVSDTIRVCAWKDGATGSVEVVLQRSGTITVNLAIE